MIKRILRSFRKNLKDLFLAKYTKQFYRWDYATIREKTKEFFMEPIIGCSEQYYNENEAAFFKLIHNTFLSKHKSDLLGI